MGLKSSERKPIPGAKASQAINPTRTLLNDLNQKTIPYCSFKSNDHLEQALNGGTDLDLLFDRSFRAAALSALSANGFRSFRSGTTTSYPGVEDWLAIDIMGRIRHLHIHWELTLGESHLKGYRLPFEQLLISTRHFDKRQELYTSAPEYEAILLLIRFALKTEAGLFGLGDTTAKMHAYRRELSHLNANSAGAELRTAANAMLGRNLTFEIFGPANTAVLHELSARETRAIRVGMSGYRTYSVLESAALRSWRIALTTRTLLKSRFTTRPTATRRQPMAGGLIVAVVGPDGAGKTTTVAGLHELLSAKLDASRTYFGHGRGRGRSVPLLFAHVFAVIDSLIRRRIVPHVTGISAQPVLEENRSPGLLLFMHGAIVVLRRRALLTRAVRARNKGIVVICDRFPQSLDAGINDGPAAPKDPDTWWGRRLESFERRVMEQVSSISPDIVAHLRLSTEALKARNPEDRLEVLRKKAELFNERIYWGDSDVVVVDATKSKTEVLADIMKRIWAKL